MEKVFKNYLRKAQRNIKVAQKEKNKMAEEFWKGVTFGLKARIGLVKIKHIPKRQKTPPQKGKKINHEEYSW